MATTLEGKVALVTGAGSGIGQASALALARHGAKVVVSDINAEAGEKTTATIAEEGGEVLFVRADVSSTPDVERLIAQTIASYGRLDCAHNNAGIPSAYLPTDEFPEDNFDQVVAVNLKGVWLCMKYELAHMKTRRSGAIVNTASTASLVAQANLSAYVASKHGVLGLTKTAALEYATRGVRVNAVCPGFVRTPLASGHEEILAQMLQAAPMGRLAEPQEVAEAVVWLCSDAASYVTGHSLTIDGGLVVSMHNPLPESTVGS